MIEILELNGFFFNVALVNYYSSQEWILSFFLTHVFLIFATDPLIHAVASFISNQMLWDCGTRSR